MTSPSSYQTTLPKTFKKLLYKILPLPLLALPLSRTHTNLGKSLKSSDLTKVWKQILTYWRLRKVLTSSSVFPIYCWRWPDFCSSTDLQATTSFCKTSFCSFSCFSECFSLLFCGGKSRNTYEEHWKRAFRMPDLHEARLNINSVPDHEAKNF